jgi:hypothetical protein
MSPKKQKSKRQDLETIRIHVAELQTELALHEAHQKELATINSIPATLREDIAAKNEQLKSKDDQIKKLLPSWKSIIVSLIVSVFLGVSTVLYNFGNSLITASPPNTAGDALIFAAIVVYAGSSTIITLDPVRRG